MISRTATVAPNDTHTLVIGRRRSKLISMGSAGTVTHILTK